MPEEVTHRFSFNLWREPWITLERDDGEFMECGIADALARAHEVSAIYDPSPLVIVGIHRLLTAILQAIYDPQKPGDLRQIQQAGRFDPQLIAKLGAAFEHRFDLFSPDAPFMQSADLPLAPEKGSAKPVSQLTAETSRSTALEHYRHGRDEDEVFCPACAARGLATVPAFTSSGGRTFHPSINGVPPIYVIPGGDTLQVSLASSLLLPRYQPAARAKVDAPPWDRSVEVRVEEVKEVGYLHGLTFPARRIRLHPTFQDGSCSRCGRLLTTSVRTMVFQPGQWISYSNDWQDPFVAYKAAKKLEALTLEPGRAVWRDYATLFLLSGQRSANQRRVRPSVVDQIADPAIVAQETDRRFRCVGIRMKQAKVWEWLDAEFFVPASLLGDEDAELQLQNALDFAERCGADLAKVFRQCISYAGPKRERYLRLKARLGQEYWRGLATPFDQLALEVSRVTPGPNRIALLVAWGDGVVDHAQTTFRGILSSLGDEGLTLRKRVEAEHALHSSLQAGRRKFAKVKR